MNQAFDALYGELVTLALNDRGEDGTRTGAITVAANLNLLTESDGVLFDADDNGGHPIVLANQEGFVVRSGANAWPATMTWAGSVNVVWAEVPAF